MNLQQIILEQLLRKGQGQGGPGQSITPQPFVPNPLEAPAELERTNMGGTGEVIQPPMPGVPLWDGRVEPPISMPEVGSGGGNRSGLMEHILGMASGGGQPPIESSGGLLPSGPPPTAPGMSGLGEHLKFLERDAGMTSGLPMEQNMGDIGVPPAAPPQQMFGDIVPDRDRDERREATGESALSPDFVGSPTPQPQPNPLGELPGGGSGAPALDNAFPEYASRPWWKQALRYFGESLLGLPPGHMDDQAYARAVQEWAVMDDKNRQELEMQLQLINMEFEQARYADTSANRWENTELRRDELEALSEHRAADLGERRATREDRSTQGNLNRASRERTAGAYEEGRERRHGETLALRRELGEKAGETESDFENPSNPDVRGISERLYADPEFAPYFERDQDGVLQVKEGFSAPGFFGFGGSNVSGDAEFDGLVSQYLREHIYSATEQGQATADFPSLEEWLREKGHI